MGVTMDFARLEQTGQQGGQQNPTHCLPVLHQERGARQFLTHAAYNQTWHPDLVVEACLPGRLGTVVQLALNVVPQGRLVTAEVESPLLHRPYTRQQTGQFQFGNVRHVVRALLPDRFLLFTTGIDEDPQAWERPDRSTLDGRVQNQIEPVTIAFLGAARARSTRSSSWGKSSLKLRNVLMPYLFQGRDQPILRAWR